MQNFSSTMPDISKVDSRLQRVVRMSAQTGFTLPALGETKAVYTDISTSPYGSTTVEKGPGGWTYIASYREGHDTILGPSKFVFFPTSLE